MEEVKFKDIKIGDSVLVEKAIHYGWRSSLNFWCKTQVVKVTNTQFEVSAFPNEKFKKSNGGAVSRDNFSTIRLPGDSYYGRVIEDQTEDFIKARRNFDTLSEINQTYSLFSKMNARSIIESPAEELDRLLKALQYFTKETP